MMISPEDVVRMSDAVYSHPMIRLYAIYASSDEEYAKYEALAKKAGYAYPKYQPITGKSFLVLNKIVFSDHSEVCEMFGRTRLIPDAPSDSRPIEVSYEQFRVHLGLDSSEYGDMISFGVQNEEEA